MVEGADVTKLSFLQMLTDKVNKMDCDGSLYSRLVEARTATMEKSTDELKSMIKELITNVNVFHAKMEENIATVKTQALQAASDVKVEALKKAGEISTELSDRNSVYDRWRLIMVVLIVVSIAISCLALGMRIEDVLLRAIGALK
jgi:LPS O-antigen subunit length determinant protein (WzzB/FepE family)